MKDFKEIKREIIERAEKANACTEEFSKAVRSETLDDLFAVVKSNLKWCIVNEMLCVDSLESIFGIEYLDENYVFIKGESSVIVCSGQHNIFTLGSSSANVKTWDSSSANVETLGSSSKIKFNVEGNNSFVRNHNNRIIYVKKGNFDIEEI